MLGPSGSASRASTRRNELQGITLSPTPCTKVREPASTVRQFRRHATNLLKADDGAVLPDPCMSPLSIDHTSELVREDGESVERHTILCTTQIYQIYFKSPNQCFAGAIIQ